MNYCPAAGTDSSLMNSDPFANFYWNILWYTMGAFLVGFKNHRGQNPKGLIFLKFPIQLLRIMRESYIHWNTPPIYCRCPPTKFIVFVWGTVTAPLFFTGRKPHVVIWVLSEQSVFNNKLVYSFKSWFPHFGRFFVISHFYSPFL